MKVKVGGTGKITFVCSAHGVVVRRCPCSNNHHARFTECPGADCPGYGTGKFLYPTGRDGYAVPSDLRRALNESNDRVHEGA